MRLAVQFVFTIPKVLRSYLSRQTRKKVTSSRHLTSGGLPPLAQGVAVPCGHPDPAVVRLRCSRRPGEGCAVSTPIIATRNESVAASDAGGITVTNARESVQASRGGGGNDAGIETAAEWGVFSWDAVPLQARAIVSVLVDRAIGHPLAP